MSFDAPITRDNLNEYLKELAKEYRKLSGKNTPAEVILIGGASILANYGFREMTYDIDTVVSASSAFKEAVNRVGDAHNLPNGWLNTDFKRTKSYSDKLFSVSVYYKTFSNILTVRTITAEYLLAMKLMSGRRYKNDLSDIAGILWEHYKNGNPITLEAVNNALTTLYGNATIPATSRLLLEEAFANSNFETLYMKIRESEIQAKSMLVKFNRKYPNVLNDENTESVLENVTNKPQGDKKSILTTIEEKKAIIKASKKESENQKRRRNNDIDI